METGNLLRKRIPALYWLFRVLLYGALLVAAAVMLLPFAWMLSASVKLQKDVFTFPIQWFPSEFHWENYAIIWTKIPLLTYFSNTVKLTLVITVLQLLTSSFAAYAFAKMQFKGRDTLFLMYVTTIAIPWQVYMVPQYILMGKLGLTDSLFGLILMHTFTAFGVFLMRQFYIGIPSELLEAARIDGLSEYGIWARIMLPLSKPAIATLCITTFVTEWNDFMGPLIYLSTDSKKTLQLGLRLFISQYSADYQLIMAASVVSLIPVFILFVSLQRFFVEGVATSGLKG
ncbi:MAG: carbohydrate ABC transporter permease [Clostridiales bacterium]|nr:carbohydrate ABC transporter permease [Clostridiales bacterium]